MGTCCELVKLFSGALDSNPRPSFPTQPCRKGSRLRRNEDICFHLCQSWDSNSCRVTTRKEWHPVNQSFLFSVSVVKSRSPKKIGKYEKTRKADLFLLRISAATKFGLCRNFFGVTSVQRRRRCDAATLRRCDAVMRPFDVTKDSLSECGAPIQ